MSKLSDLRAGPAIIVSSPSDIVPVLFFYVVGKNPILPPLACIAKFFSFILMVAFLTF